MSEEKTPYQEGAFWFSKLSDYRLCPAFYKAKYIDKTVKTEPGLDMEFGTAIHLGLNDMLEGGDGQAIFDIYWDSVDKNLKRFRYDWASLKHNGEIMLSKFKRLHLKHFKPYMMEERIFTELGGHAVEGTPDFLGDYKGVPSIVDFKTSGSKYEKNKIRCEEQLSGYAAMAAQALGYTATQRVYIVFVKDHKEPSIQVLTAPLTSTELYSTIVNIAQTIDEIKDRKVFPRNVSNCSRGPIACSNFEACWGSKKDE